MIQFSLMRAQKPIIFKGGLFYILSLETYKAVSKKLISIVIPQLINLLKLIGFSLSNAVILRQVSED